MSDESAKANAPAVESAAADTSNKEQAKVVSVWTQNYRNEKFFIEHQVKIAKPLAEPRVMVNVGAHKGEEAFHYAELGWDVFSFEANPDNYKNLLAACEAKKEKQKLPTFIHQAVTWENVDSITFYVSDQHPGIGSLTNFAETHRPITVPARTLTSFYAEHGIQAIDFFLIDAERLDFQIIQTHDWSIPISVLVLEFNASYLKNLVNYVSAKNPKYKHAIFMYKKLDSQYWEAGKPNRVVCVDRVEIDEYESRRLAGDEERFSTWGNVVFYQAP